MADSIDEFFGGYPAEVQIISKKLRATVNAEMPEANEILYAKENHVGYSFTESSRDKIVYICPLKDYVRLGFMYGGQLPDPDQILVGEGKRLRHVKVWSSEEADNPALAKLVKAAGTDALTHMKKKEQTGKKG